MNRLILSIILASFAAAPAVAESLMWDLGIYPALDAAMTAEKDAPIYTTESATSVRTRFVLQGSGEEEWTEMFEFLYTMPRVEPKTVKLWYERLQASTDANCPSEWLIVEEAPRSMTFERRAPDCAAQVRQTTLYRVIYGKHNVFALSANVKGDISEETRKTWLAVLASAKIMR